MFGFKKRKAKEKPGRTTPTATDAQANPIEKQRLWGYKSQFAPTDSFQGGP